MLFCRFLKDETSSIRGQVWQFFPLHFDERCIELGLSR